MRVTAHTLPSTPSPPPPSPLQCPSPSASPKAWPGHIHGNDTAARGDGGDGGDGGSGGDGAPPSRVLPEASARGLATVAPAGLVFPSPPPLPPLPPLPPPDAATAAARAAAASAAAAAFDRGSLSPVPPPLGLLRDATTVGHAGSAGGAGAAGSGAAQRTPGEGDGAAATAAVPDCCGDGCRGNSLVGVGGPTAATSAVATGGGDGDGKARVTSRDGALPPPPERRLPLPPTPLPLSSPPLFSPPTLSPPPPTFPAEWSCPHAHGARAAMIHLWIVSARSRYSRALRLSVDRWPGDRSDRRARRRASTART